MFIYLFHKEYNLDIKNIICTHRITQYLTIYPNANFVFNENGVSLTLPSAPYPQSKSWKPNISPFEFSVKFFQVWPISYSQAKKSRIDQRCVNTPYQMFYLYYMVVYLVIGLQNSKKNYVLFFIIKNYDMSLQLSTLYKKMTYLIL